MLYLVEALIKLKWNFANFEYAYQIVCNMYNWLQGYNRNYLWVVKLIPHISAYNQYSNINYMWYQSQSQDKTRLKE